jgi:hypothetical protein
MSTLILIQWPVFIKTCANMISDFDNFLADERHVKQGPELLHDNTLKISRGFEVFKKSVTFRVMAIPNNTFYLDV